MVETSRSQKSDYGVMDVIEVLRKHEKEMKERFAVKRIGAFGSFVRGEQNETSDIDLVVEFENPTFDNIMDLAFYLVDFVGIFDKLDDNSEDKADKMSAVLFQ